jgi:signal peptidase I
MEDTIIVGDFMMAKKCGYDSIKQNDIVIFKYPRNHNINYVKRCIAKGGQTVEIKDKEIYVDGVPLILPSKAKHIDSRIFPYHDNDHGGRRDNMPSTVIPDGQVFVVGDNLDNSQDSRFFGPVDGNLIIAKPMFVYFSLEPIDKYHTGSPEFIKKLLYNIGHFSSRIRWDRIGIKL